VGLDAVAVEFHLMEPAVDGRPNFARLHVRWTRPGAIQLWAFDLLAFNGRDLRPQPLVKRQACLQALLERFGCPAISLSEPAGPPDFSVHELVPAPSAISQSLLGQLVGASNQ
jgi:hypothetical protein